MDSGIDSTDNSNGSITENPLIQVTDRKINYNAEILQDDKVSVANNQMHSTRNILENISKKCENCSSNKLCGLNCRIKHGLQFESNFEYKMKSENLNPQESQKKLKPESDSDFNQKNEIPMQIPEHLPLPEGSMIEINFPNKVPVSYEDIDLRLNLSLKNTLPFTLETKCNLNSYNSSVDHIASDNYYGPLAVLPYESKDLQRKFKHYRQRLRELKEYIRPKERKLRTATSLNNIELVNNLLHEGVDPKSTDNRLRTPLHIAASKGYTEIVNLLLQHGADPNQKDIIGNTPLHLAACTSHIETVTILLKAGTNVKQEDNLGFSPLNLANSRLRLMQKDLNPSAIEVKELVLKIIEMMEAYMKSSGNTEDEEMLTSLTNKLSLTESGQQGKDEIMALLNSLQNLTLNKAKQD